MEGGSGESQRCAEEEKKTEAADQVSAALWQNGAYLVLDLNLLER